MSRWCTALLRYCVIADLRYWGFWGVLGVCDFAILRFCDFGFFNVLWRYSGGMDDNGGQLGA